METGPYGHTTFSIVGAGLRTGPSDPRAENGVFQPGDFLASGNGLKGHPFTDLSEVENSLCEICGLLSPLLLMV